MRVKVIAQGGVKLWPTTPWKGSTPPKHQVPSGDTCYEVQEVSNPTGSSQAVWWAIEYEGELYGVSGEGFCRMIREHKFSEAA